MYAYGNIHGATESRCPDPLRQVHLVVRIRPLHGWYTDSNFVLVTKFGSGDAVPQDCSSVEGTESIKFVRSGLGQITKATG
jgi:hypothetical protein